MMKPGFPAYPLNRGKYPNSEKLFNLKTIPFLSLKEQEYTIIQGLMNFPDYAIRSYPGKKRKIRFIILKYLPIPYRSILLIWK